VRTLVNVDLTAKLLIMDRDVIGDAVRGGARKHFLWSLHAAKGECHVQIEHDLKLSLLAGRSDNLVSYQVVPVLASGTPSGPMAQVIES